MGFKLWVLTLVFFWSGIAHGQTAWTVGKIGLSGVTAAHSVAYGNGRFVVTLSGNSVNGASVPAAAWSTDGVIWNATTLTTPQQGTVVFTAGAFYLAGGRAILRSTDGQTWSQIYTAPSFNTALRGIATNGQSMLVGSASNNATDCVFSPDLTVWRTAALPNPGVSGSAVNGGLPLFGNDRYFVPYSVLAPAPSYALKDYLVTTTDGAVWTPATDSNVRINQLAAGNGRIVSLAFPEVYVSTTGSSFARVSTSLPIDIVNGGKLMFAGGRFFVGNSLASSTDGVTWAALAGGFPADSRTNAIAYGRGRYVAVGDRLSGSFTDVVATLAAAAPPLISAGPTGRTLVEGSATSFTVAIENPDTSTTFQWKRDGVALAGATSFNLPFPSVTLADSARYTCEVRNALGITTSDTALLTVVPIAKAGRIINLSVLTSLDAPDTDFTLGFVLGGSGTSGAKSLLVRAAGPSLAPFGITNFLPDPKLRFFANGTFAGENNDWLGTASLSALIAQTGAFTYAGPTSKDAAFAPANLTTASNTVVVSSATSGAGIGAVIAEVYDATPESAITVATPRLINVSVLKNIPVGGTLTAGFVIGGATAKTVLIRATGPALAALGVPGTLADPRLVFYQTGVAVAIAANDNWSGTQVLKDAFTAVGAFPLDSTSKDAALLLTLQPGSYTAQASGVGSSSGTALVEIYEIP